MNLKNVIRNISFREIGTVAFGATISQILIVVSIPLLTRLYPPENFGAYSIYTSVIAIISVVCTLRYELAIPIPKSELKAHYLMVLSLTSTILISSLTFFMVLVLQVLDVLPTLMSGVIWLLPLSVLIVGLYQVLTYQLIRQKKFKALSRYRVTQSIFIVVFQLVLFKFSQLGLVAGQTLGQTCSMLMHRDKIITHKKNRLSIRRLISVSREFRKFPYYSLPTSLVNSAGQHLPSLIIAAVFGAKSAGIYFLTTKLVSLPIRVLGSAVSNVFIANAREQKEINNLRKFSLNYLAILIFIIFPVVVIATFFGEGLITLMLGDEWSGAGEVLKWLIIIGACQFITSPIGQILMIRDKQETGLFWQVILSTLKICGLMIGAYHDDFILGIICYSLLGSAGYLIFLMVSIKNA